MGDADALRACMKGGQPLDHHLLRSAVARRAHAHQIELDDASRQTLAAASAHWMLLNHTLLGLGHTLNRAGIDWVPIKGCDLAQRVYEAEEDRPSSDIDLLIRPGDFEAARTALSAAGWAPVSDDPAVERYRAEEGYAWQARREGSPLLEVHFRLWGLVPEGYAAAIVDSPDAGPHGPDPADAYIIAATHQWLNPPPRTLLGWWDLERIRLTFGSMATRFAERVIDRAVQWDLQLPAMLGAMMAGSLFPGATHDAIRAGLAPSLRAPERSLVRSVLQRGEAKTGTPRIVLARLLAGRSSRGGWRVVPRRIWSHAGVVAQETPPDWWWPRRRLTHVLRRLGVGA